MKRCLFGGSFDPVHQGHLAISLKARETCLLDEVVFLPCAQSPLKQFSPIASDRQRVDMLRLALEGHPWATIDLTDLELPPPSWSWRVAERIVGRHPEDEWYWLMGMDQWNDLERWSRWEYLAGMVTFIVHHRGEPPSERLGVRSVFVEGEYPASSSAIRSLLARGASVPVGWLAPPVLDYIERAGLYS